MQVAIVDQVSRFNFSHDTDNGSLAYGDEDLSLLIPDLHCVVSVGDLRFNV